MQACQVKVESKHLREASLISTEFDLIQKCNDSELCIVAIEYQFHHTNSGIFLKYLLLGCALFFAPTIGKIAIRILEIGFMYLSLFSFITGIYQLIFGNYLLAAVGLSVTCTLETSILPGISSVLDFVGEKSCFEKLE